MERQPHINPQHLVSEFLSAFHTSGIYLREPIERLAELASSENQETVKTATGAVFAALVEALADSFTPQAVQLYNRLFAQMIQFCRQTAQGKALDEELAKFGLQQESDFVTRAEQLRYVGKFTGPSGAREQVKLVIVLSRVTIGADVSITSVIIERLKREFVNARIALVGNAKSAELFGGDARIQIAEIQYQRAGSLTERLLSWLEVWHGVDELLTGLSREEYTIVDPDSRLTQLGLLPLARAANLQISESAKAPILNNYIFFPSRELGARTSQSLGQLASVWLNTVFGGDEQTFPRLHLKADDLEIAKLMVQRLRKPDAQRCEQDARPVVAINFGVGENPMKRVSDEFEKQVVCSLLQGGAKIIFDKGAGEGELQRADAVTREAARLTYQNRKIRVIEFDEAQIARLAPADSLDADMLVWRGRIGMLAALVGESNLYIGYDSAGQHIAAAMNVPCVDVFAGYTSERMLERWRPTGKAKTRVIAVDTLNKQADWQAVLDEVLRCAKELLADKMMA